MNKNLAQLALLSALCLPTLACVDQLEPGDEQIDEELDKLGEVTSEVGVCDSSITAAAITKQISHPDTDRVTLELLTISKSNYQMLWSWITPPSNMYVVGWGTSSCVVDTYTGGWRCRHKVDVGLRWGCYGNGNYTWYIAPQAVAGSGCSNGASQQIVTSHQTENLCETTVNGGQL